MVNMRLVRMLERLRSALGDKPIIIASGYYCREYKCIVGGAENSQHMKGNAADIVVIGVRPEQVATKAEALKFPGVGRYPSFTHVDVRSDGPARWIDVR
jgi:uncharacterized protein YcbK (DUF882 family)